MEEMDLVCNKQLTDVEPSTRSYHVDHTNVSIKHPSSNLLQVLAGPVLYFIPIYRIGQKFNTIKCALSLQYYDVQKSWQIICVHQVRDLKKIHVPKQMKFK